MGKVLFREEQYFRQSPFVWIVVPVWLWITGLFSWAFYQQFYLCRPWGDNPMSNQGLLITGILVIILLGLFFVLLLSGKLITEIRTDGLYYRYPPFINSEKSIPAETIANAEVRKYRPIGEYGGWGIRRGFRTRNTAYTISGTIGLVIVLKNSKKYTFGTHKPEELRRAVDRMMNPK
jgi:hypothetical protein